MNSSSTLWGEFRPDLIDAQVRCPSFHEDPLGVVQKILERVCPTASSMVYSLNEQGRVLSASGDPATVRHLDGVLQEHPPRYSYFDLTDRFANRVVDVPTLYGQARSPDWTGFRQASARVGVDFSDQIRVVFREHGRATAWLGWLFLDEIDDPARQLYRWLGQIAARVRAPLGSAHIISQCRSRSAPEFVDALESACFVLDCAGRVLYANQVARQMFPSYPHWLAHALNDEVDIPASRARFNLFGASMWLITYFPPTHSAPKIPRSWNLERRHVGVVRGVLSGLTNSEIARRERLAVNTVRTYVSRVLKQLNVSSKLELVALAGRTSERKSTPTI